MKYKFYILFSFFLVSTSVFSQDMNYAVLDRKNIVHLLGYGRVTNMSKIPLILTTDIGSAFATYNNQISFRNTSLSLGGNFIFINKNVWKTSGNVGLGVYMQNNSNFQATGFVPGISLHTGFYKPKWFFVASLSSGIPIISYIKFHLDEESIKRYYGAYPTEGWYNPSSISYSYGFSVGYTIKQRSDIVLGYSQRINQVKNFKGYVIPSSFGLSQFSLGINYRFGKKIATVEIQE